MKIRFSDNVEFETTEVRGMPYEMRGYKRDAISIKMDLSYDQISSRFIDNVKYSLITEDLVRVPVTIPAQVTTEETIIYVDAEVVDEDGVTNIVPVPTTVPVGTVVVAERIEVQEVLQETINNKDEFCLRGDIIVHCNGGITVFMGKKTEAELKMDALEATVDTLVLEQLEV